MPVVVPSIINRVKRRWHCRIGKVRAIAPCLAALVLLAIGYRHYAPGASQIAGYQVVAYQHLRYSDIVWLYLRDSLARHPLPYVDYRLEYPVLLGLWMYLLSYAGSVTAFFTANYVLLAACTLAGVALLGLLPGADRWRLALAPALVLYTGLNWDLAAIAAAIGALALLQRRRDRSGTLLLTMAVWLKLFPIVFLPAVLLDRLRARQFRRAGEIVAIFGGASLLCNVPFALANWENWSYFFTFNDDRGGNANLWVIWPHLSIATGDLLGTALLVAGGAVLLALAVRARGEVLLPLGAALLLWWLAVNKIFSPQYALWVFLAMALARTAWPLWTAFAAVDVAHFGISWLLLFTASFSGNGYLIQFESHELRAPIVLAIGALIGLMAIEAGLRLLRAHRTDLPPAQPPVAAHEHELRPVGV